MNSRLARLPRTLVRWRLLVLAAATLIAVVLDQGFPAADWALFLTAGRRLLSSDWARTFADPSVQAGPLFLAGLAGLDQVLALVGLPLMPLLSALTHGSAVFGFVAVNRLSARAEGRPPSAWIELAGPLLVLLWGLSSDAFLAGHPAQVWIPLLWALAASYAMQGRWLPAGLLIAASSGIETWGILGVAVLALSPDIHRLVRGGAAAVVAATALFLPFVLTGQFATGHYVWPVSPDAPIALLLGAQTYTWPLRFLQAALAVTLTGAVARAARRVDVGTLLWGIPLLLVLSRLLVDPLIYDYYWVAARLAAIGLAARIVRSPRPVAFAPALACYGVFVIDLVTPTGGLLMAIPALAGFLLVVGGSGRHELGWRATAGASAGRT